MRNILRKALSIDYMSFPLQRSCVKNNTGEFAKQDNIAAKLARGGIISSNSPSVA